LNAAGSIARDGYGNALGGVRLPELDVPTATLSGVGNNSVVPPNFCVLFGTTAPFDAATLQSLYPRRSTYLVKFTKAVAHAVAAGYLLPYDAAEALKDAVGSRIGG
jgi:hypothetical protein